jgi:hypothetical protein
MNWTPVALIALALGCESGPQPDQQPGAMALGAVETAAACDPVAACKLVTAGAAKGSGAVTKTLTCCLAALLAACVPVVGPVTPPGGAGGTLPNGGAGGAGPANGGTGGVVVVPSKCQLACTNLMLLGCPEDQGSCVNMCDLHTADPRFTQNLDCRINAKTKADAQKCGPASCKE